MIPEPYVRWFIMKRNIDGEEGRRAAWRSIQLLDETCGRAGGTITGRGNGSLGTSLDPAPRTAGRVIFDRPEDASMRRV